MTRQPISLNVKPYSGTNKKKLQEVERHGEAAVQIEEYLRSEQGDELKVICNFEIADALQLDEKVVQEIISFNFGTSTGVTI